MAFGLTETSDKASCESVTTRPKPFQDGLGLMADLDADFDQIPLLFLFSGVC